ncbi:MAG TPA: DUF308 domain-containing protein [Thermoleophilia bacterium]|nr:DUF308 domain-containing protein [Thermoleophilia bacterium]
MSSHETDRVDKTIAEWEQVFFHPFDAAAEQVRHVTRHWGLYVIVGLLSIALGVVALSSRITALSTLVAVFAVFTIYAGAVEIWLGTKIRERSWLAIVTGVASIALGIIALAWPSITLYVLAIFVGVSLMGWGVYDMYLSFTDAFVKPRAVTLVAGIVLAALGVLALAWPNVTIIVLAVLVGVLIIAYGIFSFAAGLWMLDLRRQLKRAEVKSHEQTKTDDKTRRTA